MLIVPLQGSVKRNRAVIRELFPAPVLPTMPIFSWGLVENEICLRTLVSLVSSYERETSLKVRRPSFGHFPWIWVSG